MEDVDETLVLILAYADKESDVMVKSKGLLLKGHLEFRRNDPKEALLNYEEALKIAKKFNHFEVIIQAESMIERIRNPSKRKIKKKEGYWQCNKNPQHRFPLKANRVRKGRCFCGSIASKRFK